MLRRRSPGFTTLEVAIGFLLCSLLLAAFVRLSVTAATLTSGSASRVIAAGDVSDAETRLTEILASVRSCEPDRLDYPVRHLTPTEARLIADPDGDNVPDFVRLSATDGTLTVEIAPTEGECSWPPEFDAPQELLTTGQFSFAATNFSGDTSSDWQCHTVPEDPLTCHARRVSVSGVVAHPNGASFPFSVSVPVAATWGRR